MVATLEVMYSLPDELPPLTASYKRRAGYKLEGEWTRSVQYISLAHPFSNCIQYFCLMTGEDKGSDVLVGEA